MCSRHGAERFRAAFKLACVPKTNRGSIFTTWPLRRVLWAVA